MRGNRRFHEGRHARRGAALAIGALALAGLAAIPAGARIGDRDKPLTPLMSLGAAAAAPSGAASPLTAMHAHHQHGPDDVERPAMTPEQAAAAPEVARVSGANFAGLTPPTPGAVCDDLYGVESSDGAPSCSHGPDPAPAGVDVTEVRSVAEMSTITPQDAMSSDGIACIDNGVSGNRVHAVYAVSSDKADRYATVAPLIRQWAARADTVFAQSAAQTGGQRHIRWVTDAACGLVVDRVVLSPTGDDSFGNEKSELAARGYTRTDRKYVVWTDANVYCGIANLGVDDSPYQTNRNNGGNTSVLFARVDNGCWGRTSGHMTEVHELAHLLGGVQPSAPHGTSAGHCTDDYDLMCYADGSGEAMTYPCASGQDWYLDCNKDDYFHTNPPAGSWLASHWNVANSSFLTGSLGTPPPATTTTVAPPTTAPSSTTTKPATTTTKPATTTTIAPPPTTSPPTTSGVATYTTTKLSGSFNKQTTKRSHILSVGSGALNEITAFSLKKPSSNATVRVQVIAPNGTVVADVTGPSGSRLNATVARGNYYVVVSSNAWLSYTLDVRYPTP